MLAWLLERVVASVLFSVKWGQEGVLHERHKQLRAQKAFCTVYGDGHTLVHNEQSSLLDGKLDLASGRKWSLVTHPCHFCSGREELKAPDSPSFSSLGMVPAPPDLSSLQGVSVPRLYLPREMEQCGEMACHHHSLQEGRRSCSLSGSPYTFFDGRLIEFTLSRVKPTEQ